MSRKRNTSPLEDLIELVAMMPWWIGVVLAIVLYFVIHPFARQQVVVPGQSVQPDEMVQNIFVHGIATFAQYALPLIFLCGAGISAWRRHVRQNLVAEVTQGNAANVIDGMSWRQFEILVGESFRLQGFKVAEIGGGGSDGGVDLVLNKGSEKFLVQCKQWKAFKVGVEVVRELYGVMTAKGAAGGFVVTSGRFTKEAEDFANGRNVTLIDGPKLHGRILQAQTSRNISVKVEKSSVVGDPACPLCSKTMVKRTARRGANAGKEFWGCSDYPSCKGIRNDYG
jgi:restriction system protein